PCARRGRRCWDCHFKLGHHHSLGYKVTATYHSWRSMIQRCTNPKRQNYKWYGARGVSVCERWRDSFDAFLGDMGERPKGKSLDRFPDKNGNYEPGNCRWASQSEQRRNSRAFCGIGPRWSDGSVHCSAIIPTHNADKCRVPL